MADFLIENEFRPGVIDVYSCCKTPGSARQQLANRMQVPVRGTKGRTFTDDEGYQRIFDEAKTDAKTRAYAKAKGMKYDDVVDDGKEQVVLYPYKEGYEIFKPQE